LARPSDPHKLPTLLPRLQPMRDVNAPAAPHGAAPAPGTQSERVQAKVYGIMALTTALTFGTLTTGYQLLFTHQLFA